jgi:hypothetical protein
MKLQHCILIEMGKKSMFLVPLIVNCRFDEHLRFYC